MLSLCLLLYVLSLNILTHSAQVIDEISKNTLQVPDLKVAPDERYVSDYLTSIGSEGRQLYYAQLESEDFVYPFTYSLLFGLLLVFVAKWAFPKKKWLLWFALFFPLAALFDFIENRLMMSWMELFQKLTPDYAGLYQAASGLKWASIAIGMLSIAVILVARLVQKPRA